MVTIILFLFQVEGKKDRLPLTVFLRCLFYT